MLRNQTILWYTDASTTDTGLGAGIFFFGFRMKYAEFLGTLVDILTVYLNGIQLGRRPRTRIL